MKAAGVKATISAFLRERGVGGERTPAVIEGGASFAYVAGAVLLFLLAVQALSGIALAAFYAPTSAEAWASVAYVQDQMTLGWLVRGLHVHGASAIVVVAGLHLVQTAVWGAYKKPRELVWWLGLLVMVLILVWAVTGLVLRWDQVGYWSNKVEIGIAAATPVVGDLIKKIALGGNDYGNLTLTRFYALHTLIVPAVVIGAVAAHVALARRHGPTQLGARTRVVPRWPDQTVRTAIACAAVLAILLAYVVRAHGGELGAPADPAQAFDARPLWYFRWLFELRELAGSAEKLAAMAAPAVVGGALVMLPLLDRGEARAPRARLLYLGALAGLLALIGGLTAMSFLSDAGNGELTKRQAKADERAQLARALAKDYGVPATGALDVFWASPMARGRALYAARCKGCHDADSKDRKGPIIAAGHGGRAWLKALIREPSGDAFWGRTKLAKAEGAMKAFDQMSAAELDAVVELMYAETGAADIAQAKLAQGAQVFETACSDCHARDEGAPGASAPGLAGLGTRAYYLSFISNPKSAFHMGKDKSQMPRFDRELSLAERDALAEYVAWLRTATPADLAALPAY